MILIVSLTMISQLAFAVDYSGSYDIGSAGDFTSLKSACDSLSSSKNNVIGNCTFYITEDLTEDENVGLGVDPGSYTITFKPDAGTTPTIYFSQTTDNSAPSGGWLLGITDPDNWANITTTKNIIIDGSNDGSDSKNLTLTNGGSAHNGTSPIVFVGGVSDCEIKNTVITTASTVRKAVYIRTDAPNIPNNITIDNCDITANSSWDCAGIYFYYHGDHTAYSNNIDIKNCKITARHRGIFLYQVEDINIYNNEIKINQTGGDVLSHAIFGYYYMPTTSDIKIYNNNFTQLATNNSSSGSYGICAIECGYSNVNYYIYNNTIAGFDPTTTASNPSCQLYAIHAHSYNYVTAYYNTINMVDLNFNSGTGTLDYRGISFYHSPKTFKNNIIVNNEADDTTYCMYRAGSTTLTSDYNDLYVASPKGMTGYWNENCETLTEWQDSSSQDANSNNVDVNFVSSTDLHLAGSSLGDTELIGTPLGASYDTDIDGDNRDDTYPYMGADSRTNDYTLPVELQSFSAELVKGKVELNWKVASEIDIVGYILDRKDNGDWTEIAGVSELSAGNTNYKYSDEKVEAGKTYTYRLSNIELSGEKVILEEVTIAIPQNTFSTIQFQLAKNYPNPFNPVTTIEYSISEAGPVKLQIYNMRGQLVETLVNENKNAGYYSINWDASNVSSGIYIYRLIAGNNNQTRKMSVIK
ncbi:MAG: T9SS type A sorting domain-containing protein [Bacteroidota bacterium]|nr:T9SS type A sorting domain-containing protein [Bacteroidota bacterium]